MYGIEILQEYLHGHFSKPPSLHLFQSFWKSSAVLSPHQRFSALVTQPCKQVADGEGAGGNVEECTDAWYRTGETGQGKRQPGSSENAITGIRTANRERIYRPSHLRPGVYGAGHKYWMAVSVNTSVTKAYIWHVCTCIASMLMKPGAFVKLIYCAGLSRGCSFSFCFGTECMLCARSLAHSLNGLFIPVALWRCKNWYWEWITSQANINLMAYYWRVLKSLFN